VTQSWLIARAAGRQMLAQGDGGKVILISSARGLLGHPAGYLIVASGKNDDWLPHLFRDRDDDPCAKKMRQRHFVDKRRFLHHMRRGIDVGRVVHAGRDALGEDARLRHVVDTLDPHVFDTFRRPAAVSIPAPSHRFNVQREELVKAMIAFREKMQSIVGR
jgi:hypothetical protein